MRKLLRANLSRLFQYKVFWTGTVLMLLLSLVAMLDNIRRAIRWQEYHDVTNCLDVLYFNMLPIVGIFFAIIISLYLGTEYSDGTIRNKFTIGHSRTAVYIANLLTSIVASFTIVAAFFLGGLVGLLQFHEWQMSVSMTIWYFLVILFVCVAFSATFTLIGMLSANKAATAVLSLLLWLAVLFAASYGKARLEEPEEMSGYEVTVDGIQQMDPEPNPYYVRGWIRPVLERAVRILPTGQCLFIANLELDEPIFAIVSSACIAVLVSSFGILVFQRKDLK